MSHKGFSHVGLSTLDLDATRDFYEDVGRIKFGDYFELQVTRKEVRGFKPGPYLFFWNAWIAK